MDIGAFLNGDRAPEFDINRTLWRAQRSGIRQILLGSIRRILIVLLLVVLVPVLLYEAGDTYISIERQRIHEYQTNLELSRSVADTFEAFIQDIIHQESAIGLNLASRDSLPLEETNRYLLENAQQYPSIRHLTWTDPKGRVLTSSQPERIGADYSGYSFVKDILSGQYWVVSDLFQGQSSGNPAFVIAMGIRDDQQTLKGLVLIAIDPERLGSVFNIKRNGQGAVSIFDKQGMFVYRIPEVAMTWEQRNAARRQPSVIEALTGKELNATIFSGIDNQERMASYAPIRSIGWIASTSRPVNEVMGPIIQSATRDFGILLLVAFAAFLAALLLATILTVPIGRLREYAMAVGRGELGHQVTVGGPAELEQLSTAFNRMSLELKVREQELRTAHDRLEIRVRERTAELSKTNEELQLAVSERSIAEEHLRQSLYRLQRALEGTIRGLAMAAEVKDPYTAGHQERVTRLACAIAHEMGLPEDQVQGTCLAATVHDIGKIAVPSEILCKPGRLSEIEFHLIQAHSDVAYKILKTIDFPWPIAHIVWQHHERMDGSGYPLGLTGEEILLEARILAVADVVEAVASFRPYRPSLGIQASLEEISRNSGSLYDPRAVNACLRLFNERGFSLDQETQGEALLDRTVAHYI